MPRHAPGSVRDSVVAFLSTTAVASIGEIHRAVEARLGPVAASSVRSCLSLNAPERFSRAGPGLYSLAPPPARLQRGLAVLHHADCFDWLRRQPENSFHAVVTDPPYGLVEYSAEQQRKLRGGSGGVWREPPCHDGRRRAPLPRFTMLTGTDQAALRRRFLELGRLLARVVVPGGNILIASHPLLTHLVASAMSEAGLETRGAIIRLVATLRGGDRPKNAHDAFPQVSVLPRSLYEPWVMLRAPLEGRVQDNLRRWRTGGFRRPNPGQPFADVIRSHPTPPAERRIAPHPSLKPQRFLRQLLRGVLPLDQGVVLDPFAGAGSTLAAANAVGRHSVGVERDAHYVDMAGRAIPLLEQLPAPELPPRPAFQSRIAEP